MLYDWEQTSRLFNNNQSEGTPFISQHYAVFSSFLNPSCNICWLLLLLLVLTASTQPGSEGCTAWSTAQGWSWSAAAAWTRQWLSARIGPTGSCLQWSAPTGNKVQQRENYSNQCPLKQSHKTPRRRQERDSFIYQLPSRCRAQCWSTNTYQRPIWGVLPLRRLNFGTMCLLNVSFKILWKWPQSISKSSNNFFSKP